MGITISSQVSTFAGSVALGAALGICYDALGILRWRWHSKVLTAAADIAFSLLFLLALFCYSMSAVSGIVRMYVLLGTLLGAIVYFWGLCHLIRPALHFLDGAIALILRMAVYPFVLWGKIIKNSAKSVKYLFKFCKERYTINSNLKRPLIYENMRKEESRMKGKKKRLLLLFILLAIIVYSAVNLIWVQGLLKKAQKEHASLQKEIDLQNQVNSELQEDIDSVGEESQVKDIARNELGLVESGEIIFYDVSN